MDALDHDHAMHFRQFAGDEKLYKRFYKGFVPDEEKSLMEGRPVFRDVTMIQILTPGNRDNIVDREMQPHDKVRFAQAWAQFQKGDSEIGDGTPLAEWPLISKSMTEELKFFGFFTVEHVAQAGDAVMAKMPGLRELASRAKAWLANVKDQSGIAKLAKEKEDMQAQISALQGQVAELAKLAQVPAGATQAPTNADSTGGIVNKK